MMDGETRSLLCDLSNGITMIKAAFGAPSDHGFSTAEGKALNALYQLQDNIVRLLMEKGMSTARPEGDA